MELPECDLSGWYPVYRIRSIALIPITSQPFSLNNPLKSCPKHHAGKISQWSSLLIFNGSHVWSKANNPSENIFAVTPDNKM
jgi:hypothetical protein